MTTNQDPSRAEFEALVEKRLGYLALRKAVDGSYIEAHADFGWAAWQAARRAPSVAPAVPRYAFHSVRGMIEQEGDFGDWVKYEDFRAALAAPSTPAGYADETHFLRQQLKDARNAIEAYKTVLAERDQTIAELISKAGSAQAGKCEACDGECGHEKELSSTTGAWVKCISCDGTGKAAADGAGDLPPLPVSFFAGIYRGGILSEDGYTADQMREYALAAIRANKEMP